MPLAAKGEPARIRAGFEGKQKACGCWMRALCSSGQPGASGKMPKPWGRAGPAELRSWMQRKNQTPNAGSLPILFTCIRCTDNLTLGETTPKHSCTQHSQKIHPTQPHHLQHTEVSGARMHPQAQHRPLHFEGSHPSMFWTCFTLNTNTHTPLGKAQLPWLPPKFCTGRSATALPGFCIKALTMKGEMWQQFCAEPQEAQSPASQPHQTWHRDDKAEGNQINWKIWNSRLSAAPEMCSSEMMGWHRRLWWDRMRGNHRGTARQTGGFIGLSRAAQVSDKCPSGNVLPL